ncbi:MAG: DNA mismatch repair protein MutS [Leptospirales bacterium]
MAKTEDDNTKTKMTPMMRQYWEIKERYKDEVLYFRMGDFYEMFYEDAVYASGVLNIALTRRQDGIPMCGVPHHALQNYVHPVLEDGKNIAICDQIEDPSEAKGIVKRDVTRILTPGSLYEEGLLTESERRMLASVIQIEKGEYLAAVADVSTGDIRLSKTDSPENDSNIQSKGVREIIVEDKSILTANMAIPLFERNYFLSARIADIVLKAYNIKSIEILELDENEQKVLALLFSYIREIMPRFVSVWKKPIKDYRKKSLIMDEPAMRTLEVLKSQSGEKKGSLLGTLDYTKTAGGKRMLADFLAAPSTNVDEIKKRHDVVEYAAKEEGTYTEIRNSIRSAYDLERLIMSLQNSPQVRHLGQLRDTLVCIHSLREILAKDSNLPSLITDHWTKNDFPEELRTYLNNTILEVDLPPVLDDRRFVKPGVNAELDELCYVAESAGKIIVEFEKSEREKWGIQNLRVKYNKVIGYFIEISKGQAEKAPKNYQRRQTLVNGERYTTEELKELEIKILSAREEIIRVQRKIFNETIEKITIFKESLRNWAYRVSTLDVLFGFAEASLVNQYTRPEIVEDGDLVLKKSRHPVVEVLFREEIFVPNDVHLNNKERHLAILTGPNMAGKSTFIRQVGLVQIMAQTGSFIPAEYGRMPIVDRIFTRIGAYDRLSRGESTFYVEMSECARIFQHFTEKSLILLDEVGRGTSTFDGISIARAMVEYLNDAAHGKPKTLFATHYGEMAQMIEPEKGIIGLTVSVLEEKDRIVFLRNIVEGSADKSYGIYVAQLAGLNPEIIERATVLLGELEDEGLWSKEPIFKSSAASPQKKEKRRKPAASDQPSMF